MPNAHFSGPSFAAARNNYHPCLLPKILAHAPTRAPNGWCDLRDSRIARETLKLPDDLELV